MSDVRAAKRALARLADPSPVTDAEHALQDLDRAADFRAAGGLARLRRTAAQADRSRARRARAALATFERFERAAAGEVRPERDHFRRGRDSHLPNGG